MHIDGKWMSQFQALGEDWPLEGAGILLGVIKNVLELDRILLEQLCVYVKNHWIVHFKRVNAMIYKLYLSKKKQGRGIDETSLAIYW